MAIPNGAGGYQVGDGNLNEPVIGYSSEPATATSSALLTAAQLTNGIILGSPGTSAASYQLPTVANLEALVSSAKVGSTFDFSVVNVDGSSLGVITLTTNTGWTLVGLMTVVATAGTAQAFRARKSGDGAWSLYRMAYTLYPAKAGYFNERRIMPNTKSIGVAYEDQQLVGASIDNSVIGATTAAAGSFTTLSATQLKLNAPVSKTASFTLGDTENFIVANGASANVTVTFPTASANTGRVVFIKNLSGTYTVISAGSNVKPVSSDTAGTAILAATAGKWAILVCDGTNWVIMAAG